MLFFFNLLIFCVTACLIKIVLEKFQVSAFEVIYHYSAPLILLSYLTVRWTTPKDVDFLEIPENMFWPLMMRCIAGFMTDVTMFMAFQYTAYSKAYCIHMMSPFISPFLSMVLIGEPIKIVDIVGVLLGFTGMLLILQPW